MRICSGWKNFRWWEVRSSEVLLYSIEVCCYRSITWTSTTSRARITWSPMPCQDVKYFSLNFFSGLSKKFFFRGRVLRNDGCFSFPFFNVSDVSCHLCKYVSFLLFILIVMWHDAYKWFSSFYFNCNVTRCI